MIIRLLWLRIEGTGIWFLSKRMRCGVRVSIGSFDLCVLFRDGHSDTAQRGVLNAKYCTIYPVRCSLLRCLERILKIMECDKSLKQVAAPLQLWFQG